MAFMGRTAKPEPATVQYNDWRQVAVEPLETFTPTLPVSVVIPSWQTPPETLARTLAALEGQTCPRDRFEVVIVDDGSEPPLRPPPTPLDVKVVRQERRGFGLARARNTGARAAAHDVLLFLDSDILVERNWIAAHARWHHVVSDAVTVASYADVAMDGIDADTIRRRPGSLQELLSDRPADPRPGEGHLIRTNDLTSRADDPFRVVAGGNFGIGKDFYRSVGGHDESFTRWGMEEIELGWRAYTRGGLLVPVRDAFAWHQGRLDEGREAKDRSLRIQRAKIAHLIAHRGLRGNRPGRIFTVPRVVVTIDGRRGSTDRLLETVMAILADREHDLVVRIEGIEARTKDDDGRMEWLRETFGPDPRVRTGSTGSALDDHPVSPFHVTLPPAAFNRDLVHRLRAGLGDAVTATARLPDGATVSITRTWALHRARRTGKSPADFGEARTIPARALQMKAAGPVRGAGAGATHPAGCPAEWERLLDRMREVRSPGEAWSFLKWLAAVGRRRIADLPVRIHDG